MVAAIAIIATTLIKVRRMFLVLLLWQIKGIRAPFVYDVNLILSPPLSKLQYCVQRVFNC